MNQFTMVRITSNKVAYITVVVQIEPKRPLFLLQIKLYNLCGFINLSAYLPE